MIKGPVTDVTGDPTRQGYPVVDVTADATKQGYPVYVAAGGAYGYPVKVVPSGGYPVKVTSGSIGFSPLALAPLGWWDVSDTATLWQDTAGASAVTADGQSVARIDDKSGAGLHMTQATASRRPVYRTSGGLHWLEFDGVDDFMSAPAAGALTATHEVFVAANVTAPASGWNGALWSYAATAANDAASDTELVIYGDGATKRFRSRYPGFDNYDTGTNVTARMGTAAVFWQGKIGSTDTRQATNGGSSTTFTGASTAVPATGRYRIGSHTFSTQYLACRYYGSAVTPVLSSTDRAKFNTWIGAKAGLTI